MYSLKRGKTYIGYTGIAGDVGYVPNSPGMSRNLLPASAITQKKTHYLAGDNIVGIDCMT